MLGGGNGLEGQQDAAHLVAAGHFHPGGQKALQRVHDEQQRPGLGGKFGQCLVLEGQGLAGALEVVVGGEAEHPVHVGSGGQQAGLEHLAGVVLARKDEHLAGLGRRHGKEPAGFARGDAGDQLRLPEAFAGAAVGTQQGKFAPGQQVRDQPVHVLQGHVGQHARPDGGLLGPHLVVFTPGLGVGGGQKGVAVGVDGILTPVEPLVGLVLHGRQTQAVGGAPHIVQQLRALGFVVLGQTGKGQAAEQLLFGMAAPQGAQEGCAVKGWLIQGRSGSFRWLGERFEIASALLWQSQRKNYFLFAFVALCGALQTHFHGRGRSGKLHLLLLACGQIAAFQRASLRHQNVLLLYLA